jgi:hypothetical protein
LLVSSLISPTKTEFLNEIEELKDMIRQKNQHAGAVSERQHNFIESSNNFNESSDD